MFTSLKTLYHQFPSKFWIILLAVFIDSIGSTLLFPFFSLYITERFNVGMTQAGMVLGLFSIFGVIGNIIGGVLTDKFGRRKLIIFGLVFSAFSTLSLGFATSLAMLYPLAIFIGILSSIAGPAHQAMMADILDEHQRQEGFGLLRVTNNLSWIIGPSIGGFLASRSYMLLFIMDAVVSCIVAFIFYQFMTETKPQNQHEENKPKESLLQTIAGYGTVFKDFGFTAFVLAAILMNMVYQQMYNSLSIFLRDNHNMDPQSYGFLMTTSAITVILFQIWVSRKIKHRPPFLIMAFGSLFYMLGFSMFGFVSLYWLFILAIFIITIGEMFVVPTSQTLAANFAPVEMRGRYMAIFGMAWLLPSTIAPTLAGLVLDNLNPNLLWYIGGILCIIAACAFYGLHIKIGKQEKFISIKA
ncbi:MAG: major facilitator superfamily transporter [Chloroflexi bacterium OLB14]|nr:MAG: major facilitator superfamily transporter [Chloroflexi bacterium OLB14]